MAKSKINLKERFSDGEIDLSMSDLQDVPVKEIAVYKKAFSLDLSNNHLKTLPDSFVSLAHLTKLDLSKNLLTELPENFGDLVKLKYLDLYQNKLQHLPLSFHKLKALKWLDLKDNCLVPAVAQVAGPCLDAKQCQDCAKNVVNFFTEVQDRVALDLDKRQKQREKHQQQKEMETKKNKKKEKNNKKKDNGPVKENIPKAASTNKKKKSTFVDKSTKNSSSICGSLFTMFLLAAFVVFVLTSVKYHYTKVVEESCVKAYDAAVNASPDNVKEYLTTAGGFVKSAHEKTGNVTLQVVSYLKDTNNFVKAYEALSQLAKSLVENLQQQYKKIIS